MPHRLRPNPWHSKATETPRMTTFFFPDQSIDTETLEPRQLSRKIRARGGSLMMVEVVFETGAVGTEHRHVHEQICYCLSGEFAFSVDGETRTLNAGDSVYVPSMALHGTRCIQAGRLLDVFTPQRDDFLKA